MSSLQYFSIQVCLPKYQHYMHPNISKFQYVDLSKKSSPQIFSIQVCEFNHHHLNISQSTVSPKLAITSPTFLNASMSILARNHHPNMSNYENHCPNISQFHWVNLIDTSFSFLCELLCRNSFSSSTEPSITLLSGATRSLSQNSLI